MAQGFDSPWPLETLATTERSRAFVAYWRSLVREVGGLPRWQEVDPAKIKELLPYVWLYEPIQSGQDYRCRLAGEHISQNWKRPVIGRHLSEFVLPEAMETVLSHFNTACARKLLFWGVTPTASEEGWFAERVYGPVERNGQLWIFGCSSYVTQTGLVDLIDANCTAGGFTLFDAIKGDKLGERAYS